MLRFSATRESGGRFPDTRLLARVKYATLGEPPPPDAVIVPIVWRSRPLAGTGLRKRLAMR